MKKLVLISSSEAVLLNAALSHWQYHLSKTLHEDVVDSQFEIKYLDELDSIDVLKRRITKVFFD